MSENNNNIVHPAKIASFMLESNLEMIPKFIKHLNKITNPQPGVEDENTNAGKYSDNTLEWMKNHWTEYVELVRAFVFWNSGPVLETRKQSRWLLDFHKNNPELSKNLDNLESFIMPDRINDAYNWNRIESILVKFREILKDRNPQQTYQAIFYSSNNDKGLEFLNSLRALCNSLSAVHHTVRPCDSPLYHKEEHKSFVDTCKWYCNDDYWTSQSYDSLLEFQNANKDSIKSIYDIALEAQKMSEEYPLGTTPVYSQTVNKYQDSILIGYLVTKNNNELYYYLKCLGRDGSILNIRYLPDSAKIKDSPETSDPEENAPEEKASPIEEPKNSGFASWTDFGAGSLV